MRPQRPARPRSGVQNPTGELVIARDPLAGSSPRRRSGPARRKAATVLVAIALLFGVVGVAAQGPLKPGHPERYVVQPGDTLWSVAARFLNEPWRWPDVWQANPDVANPNRIYPGDVLVVDYVGGSPRIRTAAGGGMRTVKLSPRVRVTDIDRAIPSIPVNAVAPFLSRPVVTDAREIDDAPYVVGFPAEQIMGGIGDTLFVRSILSATEDRYEVLRPGQELRDPDSNEKLGFLATSVATVRLERLGDPATLIITRSYKEAQIGDRVRPAREDEPVRRFFPHAAPAGLRGKIIAVLNGVTQIGQFDVVVLNRGARNQVAVGNVFEVYRGGELRRDQVRARRSAWNWRNETPADTSFWYGDWEIDGWNVNQPAPNVPLHRRTSRANDEYIVPDSRSGVLMVFRVFPKVSFALVMNANKAMHVGETVSAPRALYGEAAQ